MISGHQLIGTLEVWGQGAAFSALNPATGLMIDKVFSGAGDAELDQACSLAAAAFTSFRQTSPSQRADFLEQVALNILALGDALTATGAAETGLPQARLANERDRTVNQLRLFGALVRSGEWQGVRVDRALPDRVPMPRPDLRLRHIGIGPVAVFGASNFPLAFSVAGGDTASALAAGCPVVLKGHPAHPGTSELVGRALQKAVAECGLHEGVFSLLAGESHQLGARLVADPRIKAVGFTGSRSGGLALMRIAAARPEPIPVFAEMSSINPVIMLPAALEARAPAIARQFVNALVMGAGQFCTNPGLVLAIDGPGFEAFLHETALALAAAPANTMLTPGIHAAYADKLEKRAHQSEVQRSLRGQEASGPNQCQASVIILQANDFLSKELWQDEVFGAASVIVRCPDSEVLRQVVARLEGQLTATLHLDEADHELAHALLPQLEEKVGRIIVNGFPTGVEVASAMVHGGPFPATSDARMTSVGTLAITRFLRPVCYQDFPDALRPECVKDKALA